MNNSGVIFGSKKYTTVAKSENMDGHILVVGGVGSGKSSCIAIPTLQAWKSRVFAIDIKGELHETTKHKRKNTLVFNPLDINALGYNPFHALQNTDNQTREARIISNALIPMQQNTKETFWIDNARNMLTGAILHFYNCGFTFIETIQKILSTPIADLINEIAKSETDKVIYFINSFIGMDNKTLCGIYAELSRHIVLYVTDEDIETSLSKKRYIAPSDLELADIYIKIPEYLLEDWKNLLSLMISQFLTYFEKRKEMTSTPILFLLDEFARLGKIEKMTNALSTLRSKKITICLVLQSLAQLDLIYGKETHNVMCDTCAYKAILSASDPDTQEAFSKLVGTYDRYKITDNIGSGVVGKVVGLPSTYGKSGATEDRKIIKPEEFATLNDVVLLTPFGFFRVDKKPYYL